jgi:predicted DNA-binding protein YlxM (UPF0122 family)
MELEKFLEISNLLEYYKNLLSDKQKAYLIDHFEGDFSISEIAKDKGISRQAVHDNIKRGIAILYEYEDKLGFHKKEREIYNELLKLKKDFKIEKLDKIIDKMF